MKKTRAKVKPQATKPGQGLRTKGTTTRTDVGGKVRWAEACCTPNIRALRSLSTSLAKDVRALEEEYQQRRHKQGLQLARQMATNLGQLNKGIDGFFIAPDARGAQGALEKIVRTAGLIEENVASAGACCTLRPGASARLARPSAADTAAQRPTLGSTKSTTQRTGKLGSRGQATTLEVDPCLFASAARLRYWITRNLGEDFPNTMNLKNGRWLTLYRPDVVINCPKAHISARSKLRYKKTRGVSQYSTKGSVRFTSPLTARVITSGSSPVPQGPADIVSAQACLTDVRIAGLDLKRVPNWVDGGWMKKCLNGDYKEIPKEIGCRRVFRQQCIDVTGAVKAYLVGGGSL